MGKRADGEGTLRKRIYTRANGTTYTRWNAIVTLPTPGRQQRVYGPSRATQQEAREDLTRLQTERDKRTLAPRRRLTVQEHADDWLARIEPHRSPRTIDTYRSVLERHVYPTLGAARLTDVQPFAVQRLVTTLERDSHATARKARATLHALYADAVRLELVPRNPVTIVPAPSAPRAELARWQPNHAAAFIDACRSHPTGPLFLTILGTGMRAGEALGLPWRNVHPDSLRIDQALTTVGKPRLKAPKTKRSRRIIRIGADVRAVLDVQAARIETYRDLARRRRRRYDPDAWGLVFPNRYGGPLRLENVRRDYHAILETADVPTIRIHDLRHYHLSALVAHGIDVAAVSKRAGHSRTSTTLDIYVDAFEEREEAAAITLADLAGEPTE